MDRQMQHTNSLVCRAALFAALAALAATARAADQSGVKAAPHPNILFIMADDLGYGDLGCYGQKRIRTPAIDRLAAEGVRFTDCYAGSTVCAPSRCALLTGKHTGHARVRGNALVPLLPDDVTLAEVLKRAGYATGIVGKWGLGEPESTGVPNKQGFDEWFGFLNQKHAHNYYPEYLWKNETRYPLANVAPDGVATKRAEYAPDLFTREAIGFIERHRDEPFFLYLTYTLPHANNEAGPLGMEVPSDEPYSNQSWPAAQKNHAAMITRLDGDVGSVLERLAELSLADNTLVFFTSDNGPHKEGGADPAFFNSSGPLRGYKRAMYEGGIRVPMIVRWPGHVPAGATSAQVWAFWDVLPTLAELAGAQAPTGLDGVSMLPALLDPPPQGNLLTHAPLYWEFHEAGFFQAVRDGRWKGVRANRGPLELYDLQQDLGEQHDLAGDHPDDVRRLAALLDAAHVESPDWPTTKPAAK
jgi:arylsulfatase A-like enzyme